jgi:8-oxo-dGTP pyrophosphatase MutT (NUDIX family)
LDLYLTRRSSLIDLARDRVAATLVVSRRVPVAEGGSVLLTGRRRPGTTAVTWVVFGGADRPSDAHHIPEESSADPYLVQAQVQAAIRALRAELHL